MFVCVLLLLLFLAEALTGTFDTDVVAIPAVSLRLGVLFKKCDYGVVFGEAAGPTCTSRHSDVSGRSCVQEVGRFKGVHSAGRLSTVGF